MHVKETKVTIDKTMANDTGLLKEQEYSQTILLMSLATNQSVLLFCSIAVTFAAAMLKRHIIVSPLAESDSWTQPNMQVCLTE